MKAKKEQTWWTFREKDGTWFHDYTGSPITWNTKSDAMDCKGDGRFGLSLTQNASPIRVKLVEVTKESK